MRRMITVLLAAAVLFGVALALWMSRSGDGDSAEVGAATTGDKAAASQAPVRMRAEKAEAESVEEDYLAARERAAEEAAQEIRDNHRPSADVVDPSKDYSMTVPALRRARDNYKAGNLEEALAGFEAVIAADPTRTSARHYAVEVACMLGEEAVARKHVAELSDSRQRMLAELCHSQGVDLPGIDWTPGEED